jgi:hypothetical protein
VPQVEVAVRTVRDLLFSAIEQERFETIPQILANYNQEVLSAAPELDRVLQPLRDAIRYLQVIRAHRVASFQKICTGSLYSQSAPAAQRATINVDA